MGDVRSDFERIEAALNMPTLKLLDRKSAAVALPIFASVFTTDEPVPVEQFHNQVDALLDELRAAGYSLPSSDGKTLAMQWVRERWLYRDPGRAQETYQLTADARQAVDYVDRATRTQLNVSTSRIETMRRVISDAALTANPDREERKKRLMEEMARLQYEYDQLDSGAEMPESSEAELLEQFSNVLRELDGLPSDFRHVEEAVREMHRTIVAEFRGEERPIGEVVDDYLNRAANLLRSTPEGRAFSGALELFRKRDWLVRMRTDLETILAHPWADSLLPAEQRQLRTATDVIRRGINDVIDQRQRATATMREYIESYDHIKNRELETVLRGIDHELRIWMKSAKPRDHVNVQIIPSGLDIEALRMRMFDPADDRAPEPLDDVRNDAPNGLSLAEIRQQGGPSLAQLSERIEEHLTARDLDSAATLFDSLPDDLRRPVEILGLLHLLTRRGADVDRAQREVVSAIRSDGSVRRFSMPRTTVAASAPGKETN